MISKSSRLILDNYSQYVLIFSVSLSFFILTHNFESFGIENKTQINYINPILIDKKLNTTLLVTGLKYPTSMDFLEDNDILVLEKDNGKVRRILNGNLLKDPVLDVNVSTISERGMLGIAISKNNTNNSVYVFLYYTESSTKDGDDFTEGLAPLGNRLYRYEFKDNKLVNPKLLLDLPAFPGTSHNGGKVAIGPDNNVYVVIGDIRGEMTEKTKTQAQNYKEGSAPDGRAGILRVTMDGKTVEGILGKKDPLNKYYAYGIRNSFGLTFDPITGNLWDTENGPTFGDEINLIEPGFNGGWNKIQGVWNVQKNIYSNGLMSNLENLVTFGKKGTFSLPKFIWTFTVGPTALEFLSSDKLGKQYENDLFVGDVNLKFIYHFDLSKDRGDLVLNSTLTDRIADNPDDLTPVVFGKNFGRITDIKVGKDGNLYVLSHQGKFQTDGVIYKIYKDMTSD